MMQKLMIFSQKRTLGGMDENIDTPQTTDKEAQGDASGQTMMADRTT